MIDFVAGMAVGLALPVLISVAIVLRLRTNTRSKGRVIGRAALGTRKLGIAGARPHPYQVGNDARGPIESDSLRPRPWRP